MDYFPDYTNRSALEYNQTLVDDLRRICDPFLKKFNLTHFFYTRTFNNGTRLYLSTTPEWVEHYIKNEFQNALEHYVHYTSIEGINHALWVGWNNKEEDRVFSTAYEMNFWNGFTLYEKNKDYVDLFDFCTSRENDQVVNFYLNNLNILKNFVKVFKKKSKRLIDVSDPRKRIVMKEWIPFEKMPKNKFVTQEKIKDFLEKTTIPS